MKTVKNSIVLLLVLLGSSLHAQKANEPATHSFTVNSLEDEKLHNLIIQKLENSRFVFVGEQHGIKSAATVTSLFYRLGQAQGYNTLCVETDDLNAQKLKSMSVTGDFTSAMKAHSASFPYSLPFYNNEDDHVLFTQVNQAKGEFWGIDQTFVLQFRYNFHYLATNGESEALRKKAAALQKAAEDAYQVVIETKNPKAPYIFQYDQATHEQLLSLASNETEKEIIWQLGKTKEVYDYNFNGQGYLNNEVRGQLMKQNFMRYWKTALTEGKDPKVVFKLGAFHAARGLTRTNIYDIANLGSELAISQGERSVHVAVLGITGQAATGNPFAPSPIADFDNTAQLPKELQELVGDISDKYFVIDLEPLRPYGYGKRFSEELKKLIFQYDMLVLVNGAEPLKSF